MTLKLQIKFLDIKRLTALVFDIHETVINDMSRAFLGHKGLSNTERQPCYTDKGGLEQNFLPVVTK